MNNDMLSSVTTAFVNAYMDDIKEHMYDPTNESEIHTRALIAGADKAGDMVGVSKKLSVPAK